MAPKKRNTKKTEEKEDTKEELKHDDFDAQMKREEYERKIKKWIKIFVGALFCVGGIWLAVIFWPHFLKIFKEWIGVAVFLVGLFIILLGALD